MEEINKRFPLMTRLIVKNLDDQTLNQSKELNREVAKIVDQDSAFWIRIIRKYADKFEGHQKSWKEVSIKTPVHMIKQLAITAQNFFQKFQNLTSKLSPLHIAFESGNLELCQYVVAKVSDKNPQGDIEVLDENGAEVKLNSKFKHRFGR